MKQLLILLSFSFIGFAAGAQTSNDGHNHNATTTPANAVKSDVLKLIQTEHNFGKVPQGKPVYFNFEVVNTSQEPLKLENVQASCGCTTPEWSHEAIAPGATSIIKVGFNAAATGPFDKFITITYAGANMKQLRISGEVWKAPEGSAPVNASVDFLKKQNL
jgi:hypothetical protein